MRRLLFISIVFIAIVTRPSQWRRWWCRLAHKREQYECFICDGQWRVPYASPNEQQVTRVLKRIERAQR